MSKYLLAMLFLSYNSPSYSETWFCATSEDAAPKIRKFAIAGAVVKDLSLEDTEKEFSKMCKCEISVSDDYKILHNDSNSLAASEATAIENFNKHLEVSVRSIVITKNNGNLILSEIVTHLPEPDVNNVVRGSCKREN